MLNTIVESVFEKGVTPERFCNKGLKWEWEMEAVAPDWAQVRGPLSSVCSCPGKRGYGFCTMQLGREQVWLNCHRFSLLLLRRVHFCEWMLFFSNSSVSVETLNDCFICRFNQINLCFAGESVHQVPYSAILQVTAPSHSTAWFLAE